MLDAFLEELAGRDFSDGVHDCGLTDADWVFRVTGIDPAAHLRGRYSTLLGRERLVRRLGGLEAVMTDCADRAGLAPTLSPTRRDVGLIEHRGRQMAGICLGDLWAVQSRGLAGVRPDRILKAWSVPHG